MTGSRSHQQVAMVAVAIGSNVGDRVAHLAWAVERLSAFVSDLRSSPTLETDPVDVPDLQPRYLNAVVVGKTSLPARELLTRLLALERERGRTRSGYHAARTLDLDLVLYGQEVIDEHGLSVPHPRFRERRFVLEPLAGLEPSWVDPVTGKTVAELLAGLPENEKGV